MGCATGISGLIRFQDREYLIHPDKPYLSFPYKETVCNGKRWPFKRCKAVQKFDNIDMNKKEDRDKMNAGGFSCKSKMIIKY
jgi:hypothetical protein